MVGWFGYFGNWQGGIDDSVSGNNGIQWIVNMYGLKLITDIFEREPDVSLQHSYNPLNHENGSTNPRGPCKLGEKVETSDGIG